MVGTQTQVSLGPIVWVMVSACILGMVLMIVALLALSRDKKKTPKHQITYLHRSLYAGTVKPTIIKSKIAKHPARFSRSKITVFPGNVSRVRSGTIPSETTEVGTDREVM